MYLLSIKFKIVGIIEKWELGTETVESTLVELSYDNAIFPVYRDVIANIVNNL